MVLFFHFELKQARYGHFYVLHILFLSRKLSKLENAYTSLILAQNEKISPLCFYQTFKVEENKVVLFFHFKPK